MTEAVEVEVGRLRPTLITGLVVLVALLGFVGVRVLTRDDGPGSEHHRGFVTNASPEVVCLNERTERQPVQFCAANRLGFVPRVGDRVAGVVREFPAPLCEQVQRNQCAEEEGARELAWVEMKVTT